MSTSGYVEVCGCLWWLSLTRNWVPFGCAAGPWPVTWRGPARCPADVRGWFLAVAGTVMRAARRQHGADGGRRLLWRGRSGGQAVSVVRREVSSHQGGQSARGVAAPSSAVRGPGP
jgi:hypothetical protein